MARLNGHSGFDVEHPTNAPLRQHRASLAQSSGAGFSPATAADGVGSTKKPLKQRFKRMSSAMSRGLFRAGGKPSAGVPLNGVAEAGTEQAGPPAAPPKPGHVAHASPDM